MDENIQQTEKSERPDVGTLVDFVYGATEKTPLDIEVAIDDNGRVIVFHNLPFKKDLSWYEFNVETHELDFILDGGDIRGAGFPIMKEISKNMQNSHQILTILLDNETGQAKEGIYIPLIIHQA